MGNFSEQVSGRRGAVGVTTDWGVDKALVIVQVAGVEVFLTRNVAFDVFYQRHLKYSKPSVRGTDADGEPTVFALEAADASHVWASIVNHDVRVAVRVPSGDLAAALVKAVEYLDARTPVVTG